MTPIDEQERVPGQVLSEEALRVAKRGIEATWNMQADDVRRPNEATRAWREIRAALDHVQGGEE